MAQSKIESKLKCHAFVEPVFCLNYYMINAPKGKEKNHIKLLKVTQTLHTI